jgi:hypothetical protein
MTLADLEQTVRAAWSPETADPVEARVRAALAA